MIWLQFIAVNADAEYLSASTKKKAKELVKRRNDLIASQNALDDALADANSRPLTEIVDVSPLIVQRQKLLAEELLVRQAMDAYYPLEQADKKKAATETHEAYERAKVDVRKKLNDIGYTDEIINAVAFTNRHPLVVSLYLRSQELRSDNSDHVRANVDAIRWLESEIKKRRSVTM